MRRTCAAFVMLKRSAVSALKHRTFKFEETL